MEKNHVNVQGTEDYKEGNTSLAESVGKEQDSIKKIRLRLLLKKWQRLVLKKACL